MCGAHASAALEGMRGRKCNRRKTPSHGRDGKEKAAAEGTVRGLLLGQNSNGAGQHGKMASGQF